MFVDVKLAERILFGARGALTIFVALVRSKGFASCVGFVVVGPVQRVLKLRSFMKSGAISATILLTQTCDADDGRPPQAS